MPRMISLLRAVFLEYGLSWFFFRVLYQLKIKMLCRLPFLEFLFERNRKASRIFDFHPDINAISSFLETLDSSLQEDLLQQAENARTGKIKAFSSILYDYGYPVNWHYSPLTKVTSSRMTKWYRLPDFDPERGDVKVIWEASRFSHFVLFARAFLLTSDQQYYQAFSDQLANWLDENRYSLGVNYKCGQEASLRMINALLATSAFRAKGLLTLKDEKNLLDLVKYSYQKVLSNFFYAYRCINNNHTISELAGMMIGAWCCEDDKNLRRSLRLLGKVVARQFFEDGGYIQYSFNYQRVAMQVMACVFRFGELAGVQLPDVCHQRLSASAKLMYQCQDDHGDLPNYGSNDGALFFPLTSCAYRDYRPIVGLILAQTGSGSPYKEGPWEEELLWLAPVQRGLKSELARISVSFKQAGLHVLRNKETMAMLPLNHFRSRPAHMDQLHLDLWFMGQNVLCDLGTYSYADALGQKLTMTGAHNTAKIAGQEQMCKHGPFFLYNWSKIRHISFTNTVFDGTIQSRNGYTHRRKVEDNGAEIVITDEVTSNQKECVYHFYTPYPADLQGQSLVIQLSGAWQCRMVFSHAPVLTQADRSVYYQKLEPINRIQVTKKLVSNKDTNTVRIVFERTDKND